MKSSSFGLGRTLRAGALATGALAFVAVLGAVGCNKEAPKPAAEPAAKAEAPLAAAAPSTPLPPPTAQPLAAPTGPQPDPDSVTWEDPKGWEKEPAKGMRFATYKVPAAKGDKQGGELAVYFFAPTQGGDIDSNIDRWVKQFEGVDLKTVKRVDRTTNATEQHILEIPKGTYDVGAASFGAKQLEENYGMLAAIVVAPQAKFMFKLTGPGATVKSVSKAFYKMLDSVKVKSPS